MNASAAALLTPAAVNALLLVGCRVGGLMMVAPVFSSRTIPVTVRTSLLIVLTWLLAPVALGGAAAAPEITLQSALSETLIGFAIGLGAAVLISAAEIAGDLLAIHIGLSGAAVLDPLTHHSVPILAQLQNLFAVSLLLAIDGHIGMLEALVASLRFLPVGGAVEAQAGMLAMVSLGSQLFVLGLRFAAPVIAAVLLGNVALAILSRTAPQLNVLAVAFPVQIALGLFALMASLPLIATFFAGWNDAYDGVLTFLLRALAGEAGR